MGEDLDNIFVNEDDLTPEQQRLLLWRDYVELIQTGLALNNGHNEQEWSEEKMEVFTWLKVVQTELESDVMHIEGNQERFCRWGDAKDLTEVAINL